MTAAMVSLVKEEIRDGSVRLVRVPRWARPVDGEGYWHIPRSAEILDPMLSWRGKRAGDDLIVARFWCGQSRWLKRDALVVEPFVGALRCGTCEGRARGYEQSDGLIFAPRSPFDPPRFCPALLSAAVEAGAVELSSMDFGRLWVNRKRASEPLRMLGQQVPA